MALFAGILGWISGIYTHITAHALAANFISAVITALMICYIGWKTNARLILAGIFGFLTIAFLLRNIAFNDWAKVMIAGFYIGFVLSVWMHNLDSNASTHPSG